MHGGRCLSRFPCPLYRSAFSSASVRRAKKKRFSQPRRELFFFSWHFQRTSTASPPLPAKHTKKSFSRSSCRTARYCQEDTDTLQALRYLGKPAAGCSFIEALSRPLLLVVHRTRREASRRRGTTPPSRVRHAVTTRLRRCVTQRRTICRERCVLSSPRCPRVSAVGRSSIDGTRSMPSPPSSASSSRADNVMSSGGACLRLWHFGS